MEILLHALRSHRKSLVFCTDFGNSAQILSATNSWLRSSFRRPTLLWPAAHKCIFHALRRVLRRCATLYFEFYGTFDFKTTCLFPGMVLE